MTTIFCKEILIAQISTFLTCQIPEFSPEQHLDTSFSRLGLDSVSHVELTAIVEDYIQSPVNPTLAFDYPTINALVNHLQQQQAATPSVPMALKEQY